MTNIYVAYLELNNIHHEFLKLFLHNCGVKEEHLVRAGAVLSDWRVKFLWEKMFMNIYVRQRRNFPLASFFDPGSECLRAK